MTINSSYCAKCGHQSWKYCCRCRHRIALFGSNFFVHIRFIPAIHFGDITCVYQFIQRRHFFLFRRYKPPICVQYITTQKEKAIMCSTKKSSHMNWGNWKIDRSSRCLVTIDAMAFFGCIQARTKEMLCRLPMPIWSRNWRCRACVLRRSLYCSFVCSETRHFVRT